jgi:hypothetical protein
MDVSVPLKESSPVNKPVAKRGRPRKTDLEAKKKRAVVGRPPGEAARIQELKARLLSTTGDRVINKVVEIAMTDGHPVQGAALKMCLDRVLPLSLFEKDAKGQRNAVTINITGIGDGAKIEAVEDVPGFEVTEVDVLEERND